MSKKEKQSVLLSHKFLPIFETLVKQGKSEQAAALTIAILKYDMDETEPEFTDDAVTLMWLSVIRPQLDANKQKYEETSKVRSEAVQNRYNKENTNDTKATNEYKCSDSIQNDDMNTNATDIDVDIDYDVDVDSNSLNNPKGLFVGKTDHTPENRFGKYQQVADAWNSLPLQNIMSIKGNRLKLLNARIKEYGIDDVLHAITMIRESKFLLGQNKQGWQITFDWFIKPANFGKVLEGNYDDNKQGVKNSPNGKNDVEYGFREAMSILGLEGQDG